jgi:hypothetical protein
VTQTDIREQRSAGPRSEREKFCHIVRAQLRQGALRQGRHRLPWSPPWPMCVVCVDLYDQGRPIGAGPALAVAAGSARPARPPVAYAASSA